MTTTHIHTFGGLWQTDQCSVRGRTGLGTPREGPHSCSHEMSRIALRAGIHPPLLRSMHVRQRNCAEDCRLAPDFKIIWGLMGTKIQPHPASSSLRRSCDAELRHHRAALISLEVLEIGAQHAFQKLPSSLFRGASCLGCTL